MLNFSDINWKKVALVAGSVVCTVGSLLIGDAKQKETVTDEARKAAKEAVAELLETK